MLKHIIDNEPGDKLFYIPYTITHKTNKIGFREKVDGVELIWAKTPYEAKMKFYRYYSAKCLVTTNYLVTLYSHLANVINHINFQKDVKISYKERQGLEEDQFL